MDDVSYPLNSACACDGPVPESSSMHVEQTSSSLKEDLFNSNPTTIISSMLAWHWSRSLFWTRFNPFEGRVRLTQCLLVPYWSSDHGRFYQTASEKLGQTCEAVLDDSFGFTVETPGSGFVCPSIRRGHTTKRLNYYCTVATALDVNELLSFDGCVGLMRQPGWTVIQWI